MSRAGHATAAEIRARLPHPVIDGDGHWLEFGPLVREQLKRIGGDRAADGFAFFTARLEAHELVEDGLISTDDFRDFTFANPVRFWGEANPSFFKGTVVERAAAALLAPPAGRVP